MAFGSQFPGVLLRGPFRDAADGDLGLGLCGFCGAVAVTDVISRVPCEGCGRVVCWHCADCGVFGSLSDFQWFVYQREGPPPVYFLLRENCPSCQTVDFHTGKPRRKRRRALF